MNECTRCRGTGVVVYQYGKAKPGAPAHPNPKEVDWDEPIERECPVCLGTTWTNRGRKAKRDPNRTRVWLNQEVSAWETLSTPTTDTQ